MANAKRNGKRRNNDKVRRSTKNIRKTRSSRKRVTSATRKKSTTRKSLTQKQIRDVRLARRRRPLPKYGYRPEQIQRIYQKRPQLKGSPRVKVIGYVNIQWYPDENYPQVRVLTYRMDRDYNSYADWEKHHEEDSDELVANIAGQEDEDFVVLGETLRVLPRENSGLDRFYVSGRFPGTSERRTTSFFRDIYPKTAAQQVKMMKQRDYAIKEKAIRRTRKRLRKKK